MPRGLGRFKLLQVCGLVEDLGVGVLPSWPGQQFHDFPMFQDASLGGFITRTSAFSYCIEL